jgi:hypothetical protein
MTQRWFISVLLLVGLLGFVSAVAVADTFKVTVTNLMHATPDDPALTQGRVFVGTACPPDPSDPVRVAGMIQGLWVFATHNANVKLFTLGEPPSPGLAFLSQTGAPFFLADELRALGSEVNDVHTVPPAPPQPTDSLHGVVLCPGESLTTTVEASDDHRYFSAAAMNSQQNDNFLAVTGVRLPRGNEVLTVYASAYDSGSEYNDENCDHLANPNNANPSRGFPFAMRPGAPEGTTGCVPDQTSLETVLHGEGFVHIHSGVHGVGDLVPAVWDWRNPVAQFTIQRVE